MGVHNKRRGPPDDHPEFWVNQTPPEGWELLLSREELQRRPNYTGERIARLGERRQAIIDALASGIPTEWIVKGLRVHPYTLSAIAQQAGIDIEAKKREVGSLCLKAAGMSVSSYVDDLVSGRVDPKTKAIAAGIYSDKGLVLLGQANSIVSHQAKPGLSLDAVNGFWEARLANKRAADPTLEVSGAPAPATSTDCPSDGPAPESLQIEASPPLATSLATTPCTTDTVTTSEGPLYLPATPTAGGGVDSGHPPAPPTHSDSQNFDANEIPDLAEPPPDPAGRAH